ncbi:nitroreductase family deazaflavin-dependent oxidoreductase [Mycobacterium sp. WMMD1722]|uniref:nitroreductase family deazaflavin-dependent oxidoreductase n=1 Tax=Mycobacterium sp. WMMD1722 TaxID=3404117 RepID=UPI003BF5C609
MAIAPSSWPAPLLTAIRTSNKYVVNPIMSRFAGRKNSYAASIRHTGRTSGKQYSTPVGADRSADGYLIPLAYGTQADWLRNVLAAGRATLTADGETTDVTQPEVVDAAAALPLLPPNKRRRYERLGIDKYLKVARTQDAR